VTPEPSSVLTRTWSDQQRWSYAATRAKRSVYLWRVAALLLSIASALLAALAVSTGDASSDISRYLSAASAISIALVAPIVATKLSKGQIRDWVRLRSVSEDLKAQTYLYLMNAGAYADDRDRALVAHRSKVLDAAADLAGSVMADPPAPRPVPAVATISDYLSRRVRAQIDDYYQRQARLQDRRATLARTVGFTLSLVAAALAAISAISAHAQVDVWVAAVTTVTSAILAHAAAARYDFLVVSYLATARRLASLADPFEERVGESDVGPVEIGAFVQDCEAAISVENDGWMAAWSTTSSSR
jgi:multisubunit Na+/H+ antiporter MnhG subunit